MAGRIVPVEINTVQFPLPSAARCYKLGEAIGRAVASYPEDLRVVVIGTGGLSHQARARSRYSTRFSRSSAGAA
jgi:protocatechuate 4,5-dioxygenase, beta chain